MSPDHYPVLWTGEIATVRVPAEVDVTNANQVLSGLISALDRGAKTVIADMSTTTFCDSAAVAAVVRAHRRAVADQASLRLVAQAPAVLRVLSLTGVDKLVPVYPTLSAAQPTS